MPYRNRGPPPRLQATGKPNVIRGEVLSEEVIRRRMTASETEELAHLTERVGFTPEEAERVLRDDDLWVALPNSVLTYRTRRP